MPQNGFICVQLNFVGKMMYRLGNFLCEKINNNHSKSCLNYTLDSTILDIRFITGALINFCKFSSKFYMNIFSIFIISPSPLPPSERLLPFRNKVHHIAVIPWISERTIVPSSVTSHSKNKIKMVARK